MGIWRIGPRFGLALALLAAVCVAATRKAEPGQKGPLHPSRLIVRNRAWSICWISGAKAFWCLARQRGSRILVLVMMFQSV
jgi:hypothetical protein